MPFTAKRVKKTITVNDKVQQGYSYELTEPVSKNFDPEFKPGLTPQQMLEMGVFGGHYMTDCKDEFPKAWFAKAKLSPEGKDLTLNYFGIDASQPLSVWQAKGWIYKDDPRGWFQWYCRYYMGRRLPGEAGQNSVKGDKAGKAKVTEGEDRRQIKRWIAMRRHVGQIVGACRQGDVNCHRRQRQALLHWAYDSRKI